MCIIRFLVLFRVFFRTLSLNSCYPNIQKFAQKENFNRHFLFNQHEKNVCVFKVNYFHLCTHFSVFQLSFAIDKFLILSFSLLVFSFICFFVACVWGNYFYFTFFGDDVVVVVVVELQTHNIYFFSRTHLVYAQIHDQLMNKQRLRLRGRFDGDDDDDNDGIKWLHKTTTTTLMREIFFLYNIYFLFHTHILCVCAITFWALV